MSSNNMVTNLWELRDNYSIDQYCRTKTRTKTVCMCVCNCVCLCVCWVCVVCCVLCVVCCAWVCVSFLTLSAAVLSWGCFRVERWWQSRKQKRTKEGTLKESKVKTLTLVSSASQHRQTDRHQWHSASTRNWLHCSRDFEPFPCQSFSSETNPNAFLLPVKRQRSDWGLDSCSWAKHQTSN